MNNISLILEYYRDIRDLKFIQNLSKLSLDIYFYPSIFGGVSGPMKWRKKNLHERWEGETTLSSSSLSSSKSSLYFSSQLSNKA